MPAERPETDQSRPIRRYDDIDRFIVLVEQLDVAAELLGAASLSKARMALVAADNLAELLLSRHARRVFEGSDGSHWMKRRRYGSKERDKILGDFKRKVMLALQPAQRPIWRGVEPILDDGDAALMRVAHRYRNGVYHEDRHNATLLGPLAALYLQAVGRAFCRGYRPGTAIGGGLETRVGPLARWDYRLIDEPGRPGLFEFRSAAEQIVSRICDPLAISLKDLSEVLAEDLLLRSAQVRRRAATLLRDGMPPERLAFAIYWSQFWTARGADERAQELEERRRETSERLGEAEEKDRTELKAEMDEVEQLRIARWRELQDGFEAEVDIGTIEEIDRLAPRLETATKIGSLLERYERLDNQVRALEEAVAEGAHAWSEMVEHSVQAARGA